MADSEPVWSPSGQRLAFSSSRDGNGEIYVMNADGSGQTRLTYVSALDLSPTWSPDGKKIAFSSYRDGKPEIYVMNANGSGQTRLTYNSAVDASHTPAWSPNGQKIAFTGDRGLISEIYVMNADGSAQTRLTYGTYDHHYDHGAVWSPDGQRIAFSSSRETGPGVHVMNADGSAVAPVPGAPGALPDWQRVFPPRPEHTVFPGTATIEVGSPRSGSAASLAADDNAFLEVSSKTTNKLTGASETSWYGVLSVPNELWPLRLGYTGKSSRTCMQQLELRDFDAGSWVAVDTRSVGTKEVQTVVETSTTPGLTDAKALRRFVSGSSGPGELHFRVRTGCDAAFVSSGELMQVVYTQT